ncbi:LysR family transcriptional regulator [Shewanella marinintestina]|uniref:LysR family transcriptional regulator n=1 Tax=Shewanella marinintestina TaxID=190305 RepID=UPI00200F7AC4|nr:LysR family transcriptional regulator [Shewanella marinintestina]MCL1144450.1 LysR family transcriptional regulator [Shewanella marinintestina]
MNLEHLKLFVRLASTHNISLAGQELGLSPAVASVHINKLEESLGVRLLHRTTRKVSLTEEGESFLPHALEVLATAEAARAAVGAGFSSPSGTLRVTAPASFGRLHMVGAMKSFMQQYPDLTVDLRFSDTIIDLVDGGFDVAIRIAELKDSSLIARKLASDRRVVCASPAYIKEHGAPATPQELSNHQCINLMNLDTWSFETDKGPFSIKTKGCFRTDNGDAMRDATIDGLGLSVNSIWSVYQQLVSGELVEVLTDYPFASNASIWAIYPSSRLIAPKVRAFIDFFNQYYGQPAYWETALKAAKPSK